MNKLEIKKLIKHNAKQYIHNTAKQLKINEKLFTYRITFIMGNSNIVGKCISTRVNSDKYNDFEFVLNMDYAKFNINHYSTYILAHEIGHMFVKLVYGNNPRNYFKDIKHHGKEFHKICKIIAYINKIDYYQFYKSTASIEYKLLSTHKKEISQKEYDITDSKNIKILNDRKTKEFKFKCDICGKIIWLSSVRYKRTLRGATYLHNDGGKLIFQNMFRYKQK